MSRDSLQRDPNEVRNVANPTFKKYASRGRKHANKQALYLLVSTPRPSLPTCQIIVLMAVLVAEVNLR